MYDYMTIPMAHKCSYRPGFWDNGSTERPKRAYRPSFGDSRSRERWPRAKNHNNIC